MARSISQTLYEWLHELRIVSAVAAEMKMKETTLSAELRPSTPNAKLGADELIPLFAAIRRIGYEQELEGLLHDFVAGLRGDDAEEQVVDADLHPHVVALARSLNMLFACADELPALADPVELVRLSTMLRTEILPVVLQMDRIVQSRLKAVRSISPARLPLLPDVGMEPSA